MDTDNVVSLPPSPPGRPRRPAPRLSLLLPLGAVLAAIYARAASPVLQGRAAAALEVLGLLLPRGAVLVPGDAEGELPLLACQLDGCVVELAKVEAWRELHLQCLFLLSDLRESGAWSRAVA